MPVLGSISSCQAASSSQLSFRLAGAPGIPVPGGIAQTFKLLTPESTAATGLRREVARAGLLDGEGEGKQSWSLRREGFQDPHRGYTKLRHIFFRALCTSGVAHSRACLRLDPAAVSEGQAAVLHSKWSMGRLRSAP